jgi:hypothetical protein
LRKPPINLHSNKCIAEEMVPLRANVPRERLKR